MGLVGVTAGQQDPGGLVGVRLAGYDRDNRTAEVRRDLGIVADKDTQRGLVRRRLRGRGRRAGANFLPGDRFFFLGAPGPIFLCFFKQNLYKNFEKVWKN